MRCTASRPSASDGSAELFDLGTDPREASNLAENQSDDVARLTELQNAWRSGAAPPQRDLDRTEREQRKQAEEQTRDLKEALEALGYLQ